MVLDQFSPDPQSAEEIKKNSIFSKTLAISLLILPKHVHSFAMDTPILVCYCSDTAHTNRMDSNSSRTHAIAVALMWMWTLLSIPPRRPQCDRVAIAQLSPVYRNPNWKWALYWNHPRWWPYFVDTAIVCHRQSMPNSCIEKAFRCGRGRLQKKCVVLSLLTDPHCRCEIHYLLRMQNILRIDWKMKKKQSKIN